MALFGMDIPLGRGPEDALRREEVFEIIAPYVLSDSDMEAVRQTPGPIRDLWLQSFTSAQKNLLWNSLQRLAKQHFRTIFPPSGMLPKPSIAEKLGLSAGKSILDRYYLVFGRTM